MTNVYKKEFFTETREQALSKAAAYFEVEEAKLELYEIPTTSAVEGMGERKCFVVSIEGAKDMQPPEGERRPRGDRDRDRDRGGRGRDRGRGGRDRDRGRGGRDRDRGGRDRDRGRRPRGDKPEGVDCDHFERLAAEAIERVKASGTAEVMDSMNSKERWVVHNYVKDVEGVTSFSEGEGSEKVLKIALAED